MAITREPLTRLHIVELALEIIDTEGLGALNMRRLATAAGVKPMSLYHHFPNKEAILVEVAENIAAAALGDPTSRGTWQERTRLLFIGLYELIESHPRALPLITTGVLRTPSGRHWMEELMGVLLGAGFSADQAAGVYHSLGGFTVGLGYAQLLAHEMPAAAIIGELAGHWADYPNLMRVGLRLAAWDRPDDFATGLDVLLGHFARQLEDEAGP
jgi:TetR/AcrR family transcriptional regulator, tetracycline repressor protein